MTDAEVEAVAIAIFCQFCRVVHRRPNESIRDAWLHRWEHDTRDRIKEQFRAEARAAIAALDHVRCRP
jgi:hypothetical protein